MNSHAADSYWSFQAAVDDTDAASGAGGYSPAPTALAGAAGPQARPLHRTVSEEVQQALGQSLGMSSAGGGAGPGVGTGRQGGQSSYGGFDPMDHARLSPSAFDPSNFSRQFTMPKFASGGPSDPFGLGVGITDPPSGNPGDAISPMPFDFNLGGPQTPRFDGLASASPFYSSNTQAFSASIAPQQQPQQYQQPQQPQQPQQQTLSPASYGGQTSLNAVASTSHVPYAPAQPRSQQPSMSRSLAVSPPSVPATTLAASVASASSALRIPTTAEIESPIYAPYGSSVISINSTPNAAYKLPSLAMNLPPSQPPTVPFNPTAMGLPAPPPQGSSSNFAGLYSSSGFDMLGVLARVAARPNPQIHIGPVDSSCAFAVVDARRWDQPLVFVSDTFVKMTGYTNEEIIGRNCRFLQTPGGGTVQGAPRKYTDGNAAWHMRQHIQAGKESQSSLINYTKAGRPFINLVTIIPICWDTEEIAYFVGFQVDLVDQPNAILDRMRDGTYVVNYSLVGNAYNNAIIRNPSMITSTTDTSDSQKTVSMQTIEAGAFVDGLDEWAMADDQDESPPVPQQPQPQQQQVQQNGARRNGGSISASTTSASYTKPSPGAQMGGAGGEPSMRTDDELLDIVASRGIGSLDLEVDKRAFHKLLLGQADDFVHVLSLKGSLLYCSPAVAKVLEYEASELVGATLSSLCHPSDVVPVMRQLKDASSIQNPHVKLLYRIRRKHSGYVWIEATGKLHIEPGKGRKCVIAVARPRDVLQMNWNELRQNGGLGDTEFWVKINPRGTLLTATLGTQAVLGYLPNDLVGTSLFDIALPEYRQSLEATIQQAQLGVPASLQYKVKTRRGVVDVVTKFYPRHPEPLDPSIPQIASGPSHIALIAQTNELSSEERKHKGPFGLNAPVYSSPAGRSPAISDVESSASGSGSSSRESSAGAFQSTFKTLTHPSAVSDNVFDELETRRPTSWQFELHQLQNLNKKLRDEKEYLLARRRKRGSVYSEKSRKASSDSGSKASSSNTGRICQNCGRTDSPEWRSGPNGNKTLCNACGLRWAKSQKQAAGGSGGSINPQSFSSAMSFTSNGSSGSGSPTGGLGSSFQPMTISPSHSNMQSPQHSFSGSMPKLEEDLTSAWAQQL
ncbi:hypothetical protein NBRC10512_002140 [Rhodotorula toruloides]|uniref:RHTO0S18e00980g1_1 n=2 Tax=Rhodotorula toruloides TaxID=5286 RepID=A0A061BKK9_RHOTO|nr:GATA transcription factor [Rhodotorula toruloides NP11]EMS21406.1 GATA transcription factor [Rhodotorula toruloides NP11]CDR48480.1 RHTO0S18e00980g1_1 [Rhodotorula toruloides]